MPETSPASRAVLARLAIEKFPHFQPMECPEVKAAWFNAYVALLKACYSTDPEVTALAACRAIVAASDNGMTADEARAAVEMCRAAVAKAEGAGTGGEFPACALKGGR